MNTPVRDSSDAEKQVPPEDTNLDVKLEADLPQEDTPKDYRVHVQFAALCWSMFLAGWNDGTTGPLLPRIQEVYNVRNTLSM